MTDNLIGFELLLHCAKPDIKKKEDLLILLAHHCLLKAGFKCAGIGEEWSEKDKVSEVLPNGWNSSKEYTLRYKRDTDKFMLMSNSTDDVIVFNFTSPAKMKVSNVIFNIDESVKAIDGNIPDMLPTYENLVQKITLQLVTPFAVSQKVDTDTQTTEDKQVTVRRLVDPEPPLRRGIIDYDTVFPDVNCIGRRDLDPLAAIGGGGMLFDPLRENRNRILGDIGMPQRLPRGAVPPRARFDPFGPPDNSMPGRPPPGYDDMFG